MATVPKRRRYWRVYVSGERTRAFADGQKAREYALLAARQPNRLVRIEPAHKLLEGWHRTARDV